MNCLQLPHLRLTSPRARHVTRRPPRARISCTTRRNCPFVTASASERPGVQRSAPVHDVLGKRIPQNKKKTHFQFLHIEAQCASTRAYTYCAYESSVLGQHNGSEWSVTPSLQIDVCTESVIVASPHGAVERCAPPRP